MWKLDFTDEQKNSGERTQLILSQYEQHKYNSQFQTIGESLHINDYNQVCKFCLGSHQTYRCSDKLCYNCGLGDHQISKCPSRKTLGNAICGICGANGHSQKNCGKINMRTQNRARINSVINGGRNKSHLSLYWLISQHNQFENTQDSLLQDVNNLMCMKCNPSTNNDNQQNLLKLTYVCGHYNCHKYHMIPQIYQ